VMQRADGNAGQLSHVLDLIRARSSHEKSVRPDATRGSRGILCGALVDGVEVALMPALLGGGFPVPLQASRKPHSGSSASTRTGMVVVETGSKRQMD
jgi:hypothetical protein